MSKPNFESWIRERLYHHSETVDEGSWEALSARLHQRKSQKIRLRRAIYGFSAAAAVAALFFLWPPRFTDPGLPPLAQTDSLVRVLPPEIPVEIQEEIQIEQEISTARQFIHKAQQKQTNDLVASLNPEAQKEVTQPSEPESKQPQAPEQKKQEEAAQKQADQPTKQQPQTSTYLAQSYPSDAPRSRRRDIPNWSFALASTYSGAVDEMPFTTYAQHLSYSTRTAIMASFNNNVTESQIENSSLYFSPPVSVGLNLQRGLTHWLSVGFGVNYTYLQNKSSIDNAGSDYVQKQQIHYVGIPVSVLFHFVNQPKLRVYASVGGAAEKAVWSYYTTISRGIHTTERERLAGIQWSVTGGLGVEYGLSSMFGLYLEPGIGHYFEYKQQPRSIRTAQPTQFKLELGLRVRI
jgi:hypothetical protein